MIIFAYEESSEFFECDKKKNRRKKKKKKIENETSENEE